MVGNLGFVKENKHACEQVSFTESVTLITDPEFEIILKPRDSLIPSSLNKLRVFTKLAFWNTPLQAEMLC